MKRTAILAACALIAACGNPASKQNNSGLSYLPEQVTAKGTLVIQGGGERVPIIPETIVAKAGGNGSKILVVPFASGYADEVGPYQATEFEKCGASADYILCTKEEIDSPGSLAKLDGVTGIFFSGGDQNRLFAFLNGTKFMDGIRQIYAEGGVISGTSAGAAVMSRIMLTGNAIGDNSDDFTYVRPNTVETAEGFGFLNNVIVDQHFAARKRQNRLISVLIDNPQYRGVGIDESTAIVVNPDSSFDVIGVGSVYVFEPFARIGGEAPAFKTSILYEGDSYRF
ncbi:MAG: cyanophycinase [Bacteroidales bacterium]|nr:cyanophycinase [Bacteroidales bacterium]